jgi:ABC-2 type transport system ATP-binding protein
MIKSENKTREEHTMVIKVENLVKRYGDLLALDHFRLEVEQGEIFGLLGPNGSGKTTAINCILSLLKYDKGTVELFGKPMRPDAYDLKRKIGVVMQNVAVFEEMTVQENVDYFCGLYVTDKASRRQLVDEAIRFVGLEEFRKFRPKKLSGGLLRRLNIACGIAHKPKLIIMDEPTVAVDPQSRNSILEGILELNRQGATVVYTSHYMEEIEQLCTRIAIMDRGKTVASGTKEQLKAMIRGGESVTVELYLLPKDQLAQIRSLPHVAAADYQDNKLTVRYTGGKHNLIRLLDYLKSQELSFGKVYSELPTLNDVFLEITGKQLRD